MNFNNINKLKSNNLFKIFLLGGLLISLFINYKTYKIGVFLIFFIFLWDFLPTNENFTEENLTIGKAIENVNHNNLRIGHNINVIRFEELCYKIMIEAKKNKKLLELIKQKIIKIYGEIIKNKDLAKYLKFNNLLDSSNLPVFINEDEDMLLLNEIKIIVLTMDKNNFENIIK